MSPTTPSRLSAPLLGAALLLTAIPAAAVPPPALHDLRMELSSYDLRGGTLATLRKVHHRVGAARGIERAELRFLRAAVAADLYFIAALREDDALRAAVAAAVGQEIATLEAFLQSELAAATGPYRAPARGIAAALSDLERLEPRQKPAVEGDTHGQIIQLLSLRRALEKTDDAIASLQPFAADPCADGAACEAPFDRLSPRARRAGAALLKGAAAITSLRRAARRGDPLSAALTPELSRVWNGLQTISLRPVPRLADGMGLDVAHEAAPMTGDVVLIVGSAHLEYGFVPRLRLGADGALEQFGAGAPLLPELARVELPKHLRPYMAPLTAATELVESLQTRNPNLSIAVGARADTRAHLLGRVLLSLHKAGQARALLLARNDGGFARAITVDLISKRDRENSKHAKDAHLRLRVRLGGYSLHVGTDYQDIPRVRDEQGLHFDLDGLQARLGERSVPRADVSFMADVASANLTAAMFRIARRSDELRLVFP